jgi:YfiH family protein
MLSKTDFIVPDWPAPANVKAIQTTRNGGFSVAPYHSLNLAEHVQDDALSVTKNRQLLSQYVPSEPVWLNQVHGIEVIDAATSLCLQDADASFSKNENVVCVTMTADCLPVLLCSQKGTAVAAIHAGWRSLCDGVIEATIKSLGVQSSDLMAWLGPAIGPDAFEVGHEVRLAFMAKDGQAEQAFSPVGDKWHGDLYLIARQRLNNQGITKIYGGGECTYLKSDQYFSFRRDGITGRMATMIWFE